MLRCRLEGTSTRCNIVQTGEDQKKVAKTLLSNYIYKLSRGMTKDRLNFGTGTPRVPNYII